MKWSIQKEIHNGETSEFVQQEVYNDKLKQVDTDKVQAYVDNLINTEGGCWAIELLEDVT